MPHQFEKATLFFRLGLPSTLIRTNPYKFFPKKRNFAKTVSRAEEWMENISKTELFENADVIIIINWPMGLQVY